MGSVGVMREVRIARSVISRPAVHTLVITAIRDGDPQVSDRSAEFVVKAHDSTSRVGPCESKQGAYAAGTCLAPVDRARFWASAFRGGDIIKGRSIDTAITAAMTWSAPR